MSCSQSRAANPTEHDHISSESPFGYNCERQPLLSPDSTSLPSTSTDEHGKTGAFSLGLFGLEVVDRRFRWVILQIMLVGAIVGIASAMTQGPSVRLLEATICRQYYDLRPSDISSNTLFQVFKNDDDRCKINPIQTRLATLRGTIAVVDSLPGLLLAPFFGRMADSKGRRLVMLLNATGLTLYFCSFITIVYINLPVYSILIASLFNILGGGAQTMLALMLTTIADVVPDSKRSTTFFYLSSAAITSQFIASLLASVIMLTFSSVYLPFAFVVPLWLVLFCVIGTLTDTRSAKRQHGSSHEGEANHSLPVGQNWVQKLKRTNIASSLSLLGQMLGGRQYHYAVSFAVIADVVNSFGIQLIEITMQYMSRRYNWTMAQASVVYSIKAGMAILMYMVILPLVSYLLRKGTSWKNAPMATDVWIARASLLALVFGALAISFAPIGGVALASVVLWSMGAGLSLSLKSVATFYMDKSQLGTLYTGLVSAEMLGAVLGGPSLAFLFAAGINSQGQWAIALPFWVATAVYIIATVLIWKLPVEEPLEKETENDI